MKTVLEQYQEKHSGSAQLYEAALKLFPQGVNDDGRYIPPFPIYITHGSGPRKWDVDGHEYVDYVMGAGALLLGHSHPKIVKSVTEQIAKGSHLGASTNLELSWGNLVRELIPSAEKVRFTNSGTEATILATRLARAYTGKTKIIKFEDHFHGCDDYMLLGTGRSLAGIPQAIRNTMEILPANQISLVERTIQNDPDIAAIILEPTGAVGGLYPIAPEFLRALRELTNQYNIILIFDEVVTGFRISSGGAQALFNILPDLTCLAKTLGGGLPAGAVAGKATILDLLQNTADPIWNANHRVPHASTYPANPISAAAGITCLTQIKDQPIIERANSMALRLKNELNRLLVKMEVLGHAHGIASLIHLSLGYPCDCDRQICTTSHSTIKQSTSAETEAALRRGLLNNGVDAIFGRKFIVSSTHEDKDIDQTIEALEKTLISLRRESLL